MTWADWVVLWLGWTAVGGAALMGLFWMVRASGFYEVRWYWRWAWCCFMAIMSALVHVLTAAAPHRSTP